MPHANPYLTTMPDPAVNPEFYQSVPFKRALAWVIDSTIIAVISAMILPFTAFTGLLFFPALMLFVGFFYRWFSLSSGSATWGMRLMAIEIRGAWGQRLDSQTAFWHTAGYCLSVVMAPLQLISVIFMGLSDRGQGLTDMVLNTTAINRRR